ncbi:transcription factor IIIC subunit delta N-term-domain-containing protein [Lentinula aff. lateritia]|uniref:Transcription factor IIIC subunit delta N-term-domain-containing protein n=1 Tax=Lentinula aff. lateritia TaxID=2804960 RepID=A0ACC1TQN3_9AGAR|nr:transcription factor IIIC subunit delta N-term-domain-containing protein [Lentinula aff. lateritia]
MGSSTIYTSLNVPTVITSPSVNCLQWSEDGQAFFTSKSAVYIMTPEHGINFDLDSVLKSSVDEDTDDNPLLGWFRTMIAIDKTDACRWTDYSQDWSATSLGSMDISVWAITLSPSQLTPDAGCILAILSSNMDLTLWIAGKNAVKGEWKKIACVTTMLLDHFMKDTSLSATANTIAAQPNFALSPAPGLDNSFLVCGNRAGTLLFIRFVYTSFNKISLEYKLTVTDRWILQVAFSKWILVQPLTCIALVAYSTPDGTIGFVRVTQTLRQTAKQTPFALPFTMSTAFEQLETKVLDTRKGALTALKWVDLPGRVQTLTLETPKQFSIDSSSLHQSTGMQYISARDALVLCLVDGSFHVVYGIAGVACMAAVAVDDRPRFFTSESLSTTARGVFVRIERAAAASNSNSAGVGGGAGTFADAMRTSGMVCYDGGLGTVMWIHEPTRPADLSYKHDAKHNSILTVTRLWDGEDSDENVLGALRRVLNRSVLTEIGPAPLHHLRPIFFYLRQRTRLARLHDRLLEILEIGDNEGGTEQPHQNTTNAHQDPMNIHLDLRNSLKRHLFGDEQLMRLRMKLSLTDFAWKLLSLDTIKQSQYGAIAQRLLAQISHQNLKVVIQHLIGVISVTGRVTPNIPFILRLILQSSLPSSSPSSISSSSPPSPEDLSLIAEGQKLLEAVNRVLPQGHTNNYLSLSETCPACGVQVPFQNIINAACENGHTWSRCSITTFILSTAHVRTCIGCMRKAFWPPALEEFRGQEKNLFTKHSSPHVVSESWFVEELLEAVHRCLFCGNAFVSVL